MELIIQNFLAIFLLSMLSVVKKIQNRALDQAGEQRLVQPSAAFESISIDRPQCVRKAKLNQLRAIREYP
jgi:hypothetical protein